MFKFYTNIFCNKPFLKSLARGVSNKNHPGSPGWWNNLANIALSFLLDFFGWFLFSVGLSIPHHSKKRKLFLHVLETPKVRTNEPSLSVTHFLSNDNLPIRVGHPSEEDFFRAFRNQIPELLRPFDEDDAFRIGTPFLESEFSDLFGFVDPVRVDVVDPGDAAC